jgi:hypothetical protein
MPASWTRNFLGQQFYDENKEKLGSLRMSF